jgi:hypothetical protein
VTEVALHLAKPTVCFAPISATDLVSRYACSFCEASAALRGRHVAVVGPPRRPPGDRRTWRRSRSVIAN